MTWADDLNEQQREAIAGESPNGCVVAGPGTGKTRTLLGKALYLIEDEEVPPGRLRIVNFTNAGIDDLRQTIESDDKYAAIDPKTISPGFPILGVFRLKGQSKRDGSIIVRSCKASLSPVYPIRDAFLAVNHVSCPSLSSSGPRQWGESALKTSRLPGALSLLAKSWLYPPSAWRRR